jgi:hypothetical protein
MKTSNKILLSALVLIMIFALVAVMVARVSFYGEVLEGKGERIEQSRNTEYFDQIEASGNLRLNLWQDQNNEVVVTASENLLENIITEVRGNELRVYTRGRIRGDEIIVDVAVPDLKRLKANAGINVTGQSSISSPELELEVNAGSTLSLQVFVNRLILRAIAGSDVTLAGEASQVEISGSTGSEVNAYGLMAGDVSVRASTGTQIKVNATDNLSVRASTGSSVHYEGNPSMNEINLSGGASLNRR